jgi:2-oxoglutarate ferredoxin oxidoreductase subunit alpha
MGDKVLMRGNEALCEGAIIAGCRFYFGYPITPQNEVPAYMAWRLPEVNGCFLQAESELSAINMVWGISYLAGAELPAVIVNIMRGGPGLGSIGPSQSDYFQATRGGGHGDYRTIVLAPQSVQEIADIMIDAFDLADIYRNPVIVLGDGVIGQMTEPLVLPKPSTRTLSEKDWILDGADGRDARVVMSLRLSPPGALETHNLHLQEKFERMEKTEVRYEEYELSDAELVIVAFGTSARVARACVQKARGLGMKVGLLRPVTLWPFCADAVNTLAAEKRVKAFLTVEMNLGQMLEDVRLAVEGRKEIFFYGRTGGTVPDEDELFGKIAEVFS